MNDRQRWTAAIFAFVVGDALAFQMRGSILPRVAETFDVSPAVLGLVAPAGTTGFLLAVLAVGFVAGRLPIWGTMLAGLGVAVGALLSMSAAPLYPLFLGLLLVQGTAEGVVRALDRPALSHLYPDQRGRLFNLYAMAWAVGGAAAPLVANAVIALANWRLVFPIVAALFVIPVVLLLGVDEPNSQESERRLTLARTREVVRDPSILGMAGALVVSGGIEGSIFTWLPYFASQRVTDAQANLVLSAFLVAYVPARATYGLVVERFAYLRLTVVLAVLAAPIAFLTFTVASISAFVALAVLTGVLVSAFFPTLSAFGVDEHPEYSGPVSAIATGANYVGISAFPVAVGILATWTGVGTALSLLGGAFLVLAAIVALTAWRSGAIAG